MHISLPPLPYALNALEPVISEKTLQHHYLKHHRKYVETLNQLIQNTPFEQMPLSEIVVESYRQGEITRKIFNNAGQAWNHTFYWSCMSPQQTRPSTELEDAIRRAFGSPEKFLDEFKAAGKNLFGSGWVWLAKDTTGGLVIQAMENAKNPLIDGHTPLLVCDVWEHAYYLDVQEARDRYLEGFTSLIQWDFVSKNFLSANPQIMQKATQAQPGPHRFHH